jgi:curli biogenesis system outer membrane secretion channel CsgG
MINRITLLLFIGLSFAQEITIAVLDFEGKGVSQSETSTLTDRLRDEIFKTGVYNVLERGLMDDVLKEQGFQQSGCVTSECAVEVGNMLGVQQMIGGSIGKVGNMYTVSARIIDVGTGEVLKSANYDLIGEIEELLMNGMNQVASELSGIRLNNRNTFSDKPITKVLNANLKQNPIKSGRIKNRNNKKVENKYISKRTKRTIALVITGAILITIYADMNNTSYYGWN